MNQERLLTAFEIREIEVFVVNNQWLRNPQNINHGRKEITAVHNVSPNKGLVFIYGNIYTGLHHIERRHTVWHGSPFRINEAGKRNASQFHERYIPIIDYPTIADHIFEPSNKDVEGNKKPDVFDVYMGKYTDCENRTELFKLILYKNTKIVHTFYPIKDKSNRAIVEKFNFRRGAVSCSHNVMQGTVKITLPYLDIDNKVRYSSEWHFNAVTKIEEVILWAHDKNEKQERYAVLSEREFDGPLPDIQHALYIQYTDLRWLERMIKSDDASPNKPSPGC